MTSRRARAAFGVGVAAISVFAACQSNEGAARPRATTTLVASTSTTSTTGVAPTVASSTTTIAPNLAAVSVRARLLHAFVEPTAVVDRPGDNRLWVTERAGFLSVVDGSTASRVLDLSGAVSTNGERGLLGLDFSLDGRWLYVSFTDPSGHNRVVEYAMETKGPVVASRRDILDQEHEFNAHHGGSLATGPDGMLYIGWGDGESPRSRKHNAGSLDSPLGKILRINPRPAPGRPYSVPADNPFVGTPGARGEVFALGLRNPWRFTFDRENGDVWIGDVGQYQVEEISHVRSGRLAGANFGWPFLEGTEKRQGTAPDGLVPPLLTYKHSDRCAVIGGYVYRGTAIPELRGSYLYGDLCDSHVRALRLEGDRIVAERDLGPLVADGLAGFGEDGDGELYLLSLTHGLFRLEKG